MKELNNSELYHINNALASAADDIDRAIATLDGADCSTYRTKLTDLWDQIQSIGAEFDEEYINRTEPDPDE